MRRIRTLIAGVMALAAAASAVPAASAAASPSGGGGIAVVVNEQQLGGANAIIENGVMWLPFRPMMDALGAKVGYDPATAEITAAIGKDTMRFQAESSIVQYKGHEFDLYDEIRRIRGQVYVSARSMGQLLELDVTYDRSVKQANVTAWGYGQDDAVKAAVTAFLDPAMTGRHAERLTADNPDRIYYEHESETMDPPYRMFETRFGDIDYTSAARAVLQAVTRSETQAMKSEREVEYRLQRAGARWLIAKIDYNHLRLDLPDDADETAAALKRERPDEADAVLRDLNAFYDAYNAGNYEATMELLSPRFRQRWKELTGDDYGKLLQAIFDNGRDTSVIVDSRVLYIEGAHAVVHLNVLFSEAGADGSSPPEEPYPYELVAGMDLVDGHWTYNYDDEWTISEDY
ncbi:copper amine oxidase N-terminal domain-containing protein [Paenibacillus lycopersici]|uniref:Copper amine oxidase N-terminal domain-containing protein n=1 Tax=Paenibacillus lycopersici TaxID=2704462 RepID=A0A6C0FUQ3_9BACL|nr:stalk domain-containing protein [Paenibacillus lycopersici]QHT59044.1 copper amine oxidase N-terminal domain-containing protein [Paenibacillus lycopersici]